METTQVHCPKCGSTQIQANKKGFSGTKAVVGGLLTGGIGLLAGTIGSNKTVITCLNCGNRFSPGQTSEKSKSFSGRSVRIASKRSVRIASKTEFIVARVMAIFMASFFGLITFFAFITMISYKGEGKDGMIWMFIMFLVITLLFIFLAKRWKHNIDLKNKNT